MDKSANKSLQIAKLERNIGLYAWFKVLTKRVYLPLITIQLVTVGNVTIQELAIIATISVIVQVVLQIPTGYFADKFGNKLAIIIGSFLMLLSPIPYIIMPNFVGGIIASVLNFAGYTFLSGAIEAFMHDTLISLNREKEYSKIMGRSQSYGLVGNIILISIVPLTYSIDRNLPFVLGFIAQLIMFLIALNFTYPKIKSKTKSKNPFNAIKSVINLSNLSVFIFAGFLAAVLNQAPQYRELLFLDIGLKAQYYGIILALGSLAGAIMGWLIHLVDDLDENRFYLFDLMTVSFSLVLIGITRNPILVVLGFTLFVGYSRVRLIIVQSKLLKNINHDYKSSLLSSLSLFTSIGDILIVGLLAQLVSTNGYSTGYLMFGIYILIIGFILLALKTFTDYKRNSF